MADRLFQLDQKTIQIAKKSRSDVIKAYALAAEAGKSIVDAVKKENFLAHSFAAGKVIFIKQIMDKQVALANLVAQQERDMRNMGEYYNNIGLLEKGRASQSEYVVIRHVNGEIRIEEGDLEILRTDLENRKREITSLAKVIEKMEERLLAVIPKEMYDAFRKIIAEGQLTEKEIQKMFDEIRVVDKDTQELEKFIASQRSAT